MSEIMHALVLLAHFHALSSFVYGCGINAEIDQPTGHTPARRPVNRSVSGPSSLEDHPLLEKPSSSLSSAAQLSRSQPTSHPQSPTAEVPPSPGVGNLNSVQGGDGGGGGCKGIFLGFELVSIGPNIWFLECQCTVCAASSNKTAFTLGVCNMLS